MLKEKDFKFKYEIQKNIPYNGSNVNLKLNNSLSLIHNMMSNLDYVNYKKVGPRKVLF